MSSFARTASGDLDFTTHNLVLVTNVAQCAADWLADRLELGLGEWFLDTSQGIPFFSFLGVKNPSIDAIRAMFRSVILFDPTIVSVTELSVTLNARRQMTYNFSCKVNDGSTIQAFTGVPFIVSPPGVTPVNT